MLSKSGMAIALARCRAEFGDATYISITNHQPRGSIHARFRQARTSATPREKPLPMLDMSTVTSAHVESNRLTEANPAVRKSLVAPSAGAATPAASLCFRCHRPRDRLDRRITVRCKLQRALERERFEAVAAGPVSRAVSSQLSCELLSL